jgi:hypothetical protein
MNDKWISCYERLPKNEGSYRVCTALDCEIDVYWDGNKWKFSSHGDRIEWWKENPV